MTPPKLPSIKKRRRDPAALDFDGLRQAGIDMLQALCGESWTDYNLHDPGVTMLEQVCFGLTDLVYRTGFETEDYLFGPGGRIDGEQLALLPPEEVLPCHPVTPADYKKVFADALPEVRNVWVESAPDGPIKGLYNIHFQLAESVQDSPEKVQDVLARATALYHRHRNLCEDLGEIGVVGHRDYRLAGEIEMDGRRTASEVLADIYFACLTAISPPISQRPYHDLADEALEHLFEGPFTAHGHIEAGAFRPWGGATLSELVQAVSQVEGVKRIATLELLDQEGRPCQAALGERGAKRVPRLGVPRQSADLLIRLRLDGRERSVAMVDFIGRLERLNFAADSRRHGRQASDPVSPLPAGEAPAFSDYTSVQHHFPPVYGLGAYGLPESAPPARKAQARQLQAYMLLFDQIMANFLQGVQELPRLFSRDESLGRTYFHQVLGNRDLPGVEKLYPAGFEGMDEGLSKILADLDNFGDRRCRALDFLLALHGEKFSQRSLRNFSLRTGRALDEELIRAKSAFLQRVPRLNARRLAAHDYRLGPAENNISGLAEKLGLLLGLPPMDRHPMTVMLRARRFHPVRDSDFCRAAGIEHADRLSGAQAAILLADEAANPAERQGTPSFLDKGLVCAALLNGGGELSRYRIVADGQSYRLYFDLGGENGYGLLYRHASKRAVVAEANRLSRAIEALVTETLGFHLIEHILLRPAGKGGAPNGDNGFYNFRISAVFPAWSARLANPEFRKLVEETLFLCSPAHLRVDAIWLEYEQMAVFERLYWRWLRQKSAKGTSPEAAGEAARTLALFLQRHGSRSGEPTRWV